MTPQIQDLLQSLSRFDITVDGEDVTIYLDWNYTPAIPGRYSGPPEYCYPDEPEEFAILESYDIEGEPIDLHTAANAELLDRVYNKIREIELVLEEQREQQAIEDDIERYAYNTPLDDIPF